MEPSKPRGRTALLATVTVMGTGTLWGLYWLPVRRLAEIGLPGAWGTLVIVLAGTLLLGPLAVLRRRRFSRADPAGIASVALGGVAFMLYSVGFAYGRVAIVILLFFLTPVWSTLIARYGMGWSTPRLRMAAIAVGIAGLAVMLGADGQIPVPRRSGEWLALLSGIFWSVATTGMRTRSNLAPAEAAFVFAAGASLGALALAPFLAPWPFQAGAVQVGRIIGWAVTAGGIWWALSMAGLMWAAPRLEPARVGILLMAEVIVGTVSAALIVNELISALEVIGGTLVLLAGVLEVWPIKGSGTSGAA